MVETYYTMVMVCFILCTVVIFLKNLCLQHVTCDVGDVVASGFFTYNILFGPGILARRTSSNTAFVHSTGFFSEVLMQYNYGCGKVYNFDEEELAYYDGVYLRLLNDEDEGIIKTNNIQDNVTRTSLEVEKTTILSKLAFVAQDDNRMFSRGEEIVIRII